MTVIVRKTSSCARPDECRVSACFCCSPPVPWENDERNPAAHGGALSSPRTGATTASSDAQTARDLTKEDR